jgi:hypothetical protein
VRPNAGPDAIAALVGPAPCDDCPHRRQCGRARLACVAYAMFVRGASARRWKVAPRQPSRWQFERLFASEAA